MYFLSTVQLLVIGLSFDKTNCVLRSTFDGILYGELHPHTKSVAYSRTRQEEWRNLTKLVETNRLEGKGLFCSTSSHGKWIAYPSHNFQLHDGDNFNVENGRILRILIGEGCIETETVESIQPITTLKKYSFAHLTIFTRPNFVGVATIFDPKAVELGLTRISSANLRVGSVILLGSKNWTLQDTETAKCLIAPYPSGNPITDPVCFLPNVDFSSPVRIRRGCSSSTKPENIFELNTCYGEGEHVIKIGPGPSVCKEDLTKDEESTLLKYTGILRAWRFRVSNGRASSSKDKGAEKTISKLIGDFGKLCSEVSNEYLKILQYILILSHSEKYDQQSIAVKWNPVDKFLSQCGNYSQNLGLDSVDPKLFLNPEQIDYQSSSMELERSLPNESNINGPLKNLETREKVAMRCNLTDTFLNNNIEISKSLNELALETDQVETQISLILVNTIARCMGLNVLEERQSALVNFFSSASAARPVKLSKLNELHPYMLNGFSMKTEGSRMLRCFGKTYADLGTSEKETAIQYLKAMYNSE